MEMFGGSVRARNLTVLALVAVGASMSAHVSGPSHRTPAVHVKFDPSSPTGSPFPSDRFTVSDRTQNTGRRVALPMPADCVAKLSDCQDIAVLNHLDGFNQHPRISIPFDGAIDVSTVTSSTVFLIALGDALVVADSRAEAERREMFPASAGRIVGINQVIWNPATTTLHAYADEMLDEHSRYVLVVTTGVHDTVGNAIARSAEFERYELDAVVGDGPHPQWYHRALLTAEWAARRVGIQRSEIAALSLFTTQSSTYQVEQIHRQISAATPAPANFNIGPGGSRAIFGVGDVSAMIYNAQLTAGPALTAQNVALPLIRFVPGAVDRVALGRFTSPDYMVHPGEFIPEISTRTGSLTVQGWNDIDFTLYLPAGAMPPNGWPVMIFGHGSGSTHHAGLAARAAIAASHGMAVIGFSMVGHAFGAAGTFTVRLTDGRVVTFPTPGRGFDQNGDGVIGSIEGSEAAEPRRIRRNADAMVQNVADLMQLVRVIQVGIDADGDGIADLDPGRIYYFGYSLGGKYGTEFVAYEPAVKAAVFAGAGGPLIDNRRIAPGSQFRGQLGADLGARMPSLLNSAYGLTDIGGIPVGAPFFNENIPLRDLPPVTDLVPGAEAIQEYFDHAVWSTNTGNPAAYAARIRRNPPAGIEPRPTLYQMFRSDQSESNPLTAELIRAGGLEDRVVVYRHDLFWIDHPTVMKDPHLVLNNLLTPTISVIAVEGQTQIVEFLLSDGVTITHPEPAAYWEVPIAGRMPETFAFIQ